MIGFVVAIHLLAIFVVAACQGIASDENQRRCAETRWRSNFVEVIAWQKAERRRTVRRLVIGGALIALYLTLSIGGIYP